MPKLTCSIQGCERKVHARTYCKTHYTRWSKNGDPGPATIQAKRIDATCSITGCNRKHGSQGMCYMHYQRSNRGLPMTPDPLSPTYGLSPAEKLEALTITQGRCCIWTGKSGTDGYGTIDGNGNRVLAHRLAYTINHGPIPDGMQIDHICGNRRCVKPDHLRLATPQQNAEYRALPRLGSSGFRGVHKTLNGKWKASVNHQGNRIYTETFASKYEAAIAAAKKRLEVYDFKHANDIRLAGMKPKNLKSETLGKHQDIELTGLD